MMTTAAPQTDPTADELAELLEDRGSGLTASQLAQTREPLGRLRVAPRVFQPRDMSDRSWEKTDHITELAKAVRARRVLDAIIVFPIAGERYVVDGHCRLEAYRKAGWKDNRKVPVRYLKGTMADALAEAVRQNAKDKLRWTHADKAEAAWRMVRFSERRDCYSLREISAETGVSKSTVGNMRKALEENPSGDSGDDVRSLTWQEVLRGKRSATVYDDTWEEKLVAAMALKLRKALGKVPDTQPELFERAIEEAYPNAWRRLRDEREALEGDEDDEPSDF